MFHIVRSLAFTLNKCFQPPSLSFSEHICRSNTRLRLVMGTIMIDQIMRVMIDHDLIEGTL